MLDNERIQELKQNAELVIELIEKIEYLMESSDRSEDILRKEKQYYMDEYRKTSDDNRKLRAEISLAKSLFKTLECDNKQCRHNSNGSCQSEKIIIGLDGLTYCKMSEDKLKNDELMKQAFNFLNKYPKIESHDVSDEDGTYVAETFTSRDSDTIEEVVRVTQDFLTGIINNSEKIWLRVFPELREIDGKYRIRLRIAHKI
jgi:hypothetical protein